MKEHLKAEFAQLEAEAVQAESLQAESLQIEPPAGSPQTAELLLPVIDLGCTVLVPNWNIQPPEKKALSEAYAAVLDKYFPDSLNNFGVELSALLMTAAIVGPRLSVQRKIEKIEPEKKDKE